MLVLRAREEDPLASIIDFPAATVPSPAETLRLIEVFLRVADPVARQRIIAIVEALAADGERASAAGSGPAGTITAKSGADILAICRHVLER